MLASLYGVDLGYLIFIILVDRIDWFDLNSVMAIFQLLIDWFDFIHHISNISVIKRWLLKIGYPINRLVILLCSWWCYYNSIIYMSYIKYQISNSCIFNIFLIIDITSASFKIKFVFPKSRSWDILPYICIHFMGFCHVKSVKIATNENYSHSD